jgi:hypothetical protein
MEALQWIVKALEEAQSKGFGLDELMKKPKTYIHNDRSQGITPMYDDDEYLEWLMEERKRKTLEQ